MENVSGEGVVGPHGTKRGLMAVSAVTALILMVPLVAMQFSEEVNWTIGDFVVAAFLLLGTGFTFVFAARKVTSKPRRLLLGAVLAVALLLVWAELAVGIIGTLPFSGA